MTLRKFAVALAACCATLAASGSAGLSAQTTTLRQAAPQVPNGRELAQPSVLPQDVQSCPGYKVYVTLRGVAFLCYERTGNSGRGFVMVVRSNQYSDAGHAAVSLLMEQHAQAQAYFTNKNAKGSSLLVKHRAASQEARAICAMTTAPSGVTPCREVVSLGY